VSVAATRTAFAWNCAGNTRVIEVVQTDKVAAGAALVSAIVIARFAIVHWTVRRAVPLVSTKRALLPPASGA
jgi:hypothetical protein